VRSGTRCDTHKTPVRGRPYRRASEHVLAATHCAICTKPFTHDSRPTRGHIVALEDGGTNAPENFQAECEACNKGRQGS
jgi:5-methylcytosine-specific restriction endonuclease McrA